MDTQRILQACLASITLVLGIAAVSESKETGYYFSGTEFIKTLKNNGAVERKSYCKDKIDVEELGLSQEIVARGDSELYVSPNEIYFVFSGRAGRDSISRFFLVNLTECRVVRELPVGDLRDPFDYAAVFSPDSKKLYISFHISDDTKPYAWDFWITKEFSEVEFRNDKILKNIIVPHILFRLSNDGKYLLSMATPKKLPITVFPGWAVYDLQNDIEIFKMENWKAFYGKRKLIKGDVPPDIYDGFLMFNF